MRLIGLMQTEFGTYTFFDDKGEILVSHKDGPPIPVTDMQGDELHKLLLRILDGYNAKCEQVSSLLKGM